MKKKSNLLVIAEGNYPDSVDQWTISDIDEGDCANLAEYDTVIMNYSKLDESDIQTISNSEAINTDKITRFLWGDPDKEFYFILGDNAGYEESGRIPYQEFLPFNLNISDNKSGEELDIVRDVDFQEFFDEINGWNFELRDDPKYRPETLDTFMTTESLSKFSRTRCSIEPIAMNGYNTLVSYQIRFNCKFIYKSDWLSAKFFLLQSPANIQSGIYKILERKDIHISTEEPEWTDEIVVPDEEDVIDDIESLKEDIEELRKDVSQKEEELDKVTEYKELLYEKDDKLRDIVWKVLEEIRFDVDKYDDEDEDGSLNHNGRTYLLEIKGRDNRNAKTDDVRQLNDHMSRYLADEKEVPAGLLIVNHMRFDSPNERPEAFNGDIKESLEKSSRDIFAMTTTDLFNIYCDYRDDKIDEEEAKKKIINYSDE